MNCPHCQSSNTKKYGFNKSIQRYKCKACLKLFSEKYSEGKLTQEHKELISKLVIEGNNSRAISRILGICSHVTIWSFLKKSPVPPEKYHPISNW